MRASPPSEQGPEVGPGAMRFEPADADVLHRLLAWRRDVRHFRPDPVDEAALARLRRAMDRAPSVGNARPWRVVRVEDPALRAAVRAEFARCQAEAALGYEGDRRAAYARLKLAGLDAAVLLQTEGKGVVGA